MLTVSFVVINAISTTRTWARGRIDSERGASAVEYALLVGLIAAVIVGVVLALGTNLTSIFNNTNHCITQTGTCTTATTTG